MNRVLKSCTVATAVLGAVLAASAAPASAATANGNALDVAKQATTVNGKALDVAKQAVTARIDLRLAALTRFGTELAGAKQVQAGHRSTLSTLLGDQTTELKALRVKVGGETTGTAVKADAQSMVDDFRVFILTGPKVHLTAAIDTELAVVGKLRTHKDVDQGKLDAIQSSLGGKVDTLLGIKPGPDGDAIRAQVKPIRDAAKSARQQLKSLKPA
jgi:hypothetical protein